MSNFWTESFLGTRGSFMLDFVSLAMVAIVLVLAASILLVRRRHAYSVHKRCQLVLATLLAVTIVLFEIDVRFITNWQLRAEPSPYFERGTWNLVYDCLIIHLCFAIPTALLWFAVIVRALRRFPRPPVPGAHSRRHAQLGWLGAVGMALTALTGWLFYWLAFAAV